MSLSQTTVDGVTVSVGDWVSFKSDIEQSGQISNIKRGAYHGVELDLIDDDGFSGDYIGGQTITTVMAVDCWVD